MPTFSSLPSGSAHSPAALALFVFEKSKRPESAFLFGSLVEEALKIARDDGFDGKLGTVILVRTRDRKYPRILFAGLGTQQSFSTVELRLACGWLARKADSLGITHLALRPDGGAGAELSARAAVEGLMLGSYRYRGFQTTPNNKNALAQIYLIARDSRENSEFKTGLRDGQHFSSSVLFARDLINRPPSDTTPQDLVQEARRIAKGQITLKVFNKLQLERLGMGALLGVNRGSHQPPYFLHFTYRPRKGRVKRKIGICGKGITFDSGGLSLKPAKSMETMKYDMSGAASVLAVFRALSHRNLPIEVHGFAPLTENMPGGNAVKPGDVLKTLRGKTIEVLNTDAEGRLILADALSYASRQKLDEVIDIATLTGACVVALGNQIACVMGTDPALVERLKSTSRKAGEKLWELPLEKDYEPLLKSQVADIKNIGPVGEAGTILAGLFLKEFVDKGLPWAHLDIASTGWTSSPTALSDTGATGVMIRTLLYYLYSYN